MAFLNNTSDEDLPEDSPVYLAKSDYDFVKAKGIIANMKSITGDTTQDSTDLRSLRRKYLFPRFWPYDFDELHNVLYNHPTVRFLETGSYIKFSNVDLTNINKISLDYISDKGGSFDIRMESAQGPVLASINLDLTSGFQNQASGDIKPVRGKKDIYVVFKTDEPKPADGRLYGIKFLTGGNKGKKEVVLDSLRKELAQYINPSGTLVMQELAPDKKRITHVFNRGSWIDKGEKVEAAVPKALNPMPQGAPKNRLGMAQWLVSKDNPLTARVAVNRFWEQLFGYGIVETLEDFGSQGNKPTHPELLDWLAVTFMDDCAWSMKKILRVMVLSGTYRQSSVAQREHLEKDPKNQYFARGPRVRLTAEQIRDQALAVSGLLSKKMNGPSVMPHQPERVWQTVYNGMEWKLSEGEDQFRRAVYTYIKRTSPYPNMLNFDGPSREFCMVRRIRSNTPLQALAVLNDTVSTIVSVAMAKRMMEEGGNDVTACIKRGYKMALFHEPDANALNKLVAFYNKMDNYYKQNKDKAVLFTGSKESGTKLAPLALVAGVIINQDEFLTKE
jgi:hypothetical protein